MPERDGYIPGVPCWIDTSQPDPEAAVDFYRGLFGWEFENVLPPEAPGKYFIGRIRGGDVAAVGSIPEGAPPIAMWNTYIWVESADQTAAKVRDAGGKVLTEPFDVMDSGRMAVFADPEGAAFCVWQAKAAQGRADRQRARLAELQRPQHPRRGRREVLLWLSVRLADPGAAGRRRDVDVAGLRRPSGGAPPRRPQAGGRGGRSGGLRGRRGEHQPDPRGPAGRTGALERDVRDRRRRRHGREGERAGREGDRPAVRRPLGQDDRAQPIPRARRSSRASSCRRTGISQVRRTRRPARHREGIGECRADIQCARRAVVRPPSRSRAPDQPRDGESIRAGAPADCPARARPRPRGRPVARRAVLAQRARSRRPRAPRGTRAQPSRQAGRVESTRLCAPR